MELGVRIGSGIALHKGKAAVPVLRLGHMAQQNSSWRNAVYFGVVFSAWKGEFSGGSVGN